MAMWQKYFWNRNSNIKEIKKKKNANTQYKLAIFSTATGSANKIIQILHGNGQIKKNWPELSSLGQEPTFKFGQ